MPTAYDAPLAGLFIALVVGFIFYRFGRSIMALAKDDEVRSLLSLALITILSGTFVYRWLEGWTFVDSLYFTVITLTTVGYGDLSPTNPASKLFTVAYILIGLGIISSFIVVIAERSQLQFTAIGRRSNDEK